MAALHSTVENRTAFVRSDDQGEEHLPEVGPDDPARDAFLLAVLQASRQLRQNAPGAMQGDPTGVHQMRTAARRFRSTLRLYRPLLEGPWADHVSEQLAWLGEQLGAVRDADVRRHLLGASAGVLTEELGPLFSALQERHATATSQLHLGFESDRYRDLLVQIQEAPEVIAFQEEAWQPCREALPPLVRTVWKRLKSEGRALDLSSEPAAFHRVRKRAKRARFAAESVAPCLGPDSGHAARRFAKRARAVQDVLGRHQDAIIASQEIRRVAAEHPSDGAFNLAMGQLLERQENAAGESRREFFKIWHRLDRKKVRHWFARSIDR
jgi:CHAD domain-containing protein